MDYDHGLLWVHNLLANHCCGYYSWWSDLVWASCLIDFKLVPGLFNANLLPSNTVFSTSCYSLSSDYQAWLASNASRTRDISCLLCQLKARYTHSKANATRFDWDDFASHYRQVEEPFVDQHQEKLLVVFVFNRYQVPRLIPDSKWRMSLCWVLSIVLVSQ